MPTPGQCNSTTATSSVLWWTVETKRQLVLGAAMQVLTENELLTACLYSKNFFHAKFCSSTVSSWPYEASVCTTLLTWLTYRRKKVSTNSIRQRETLALPRLQINELCSNAIAAGNDRCTPALRRHYHRWLGLLLSVGGKEHYQRSHPGTECGASFLSRKRFEMPC